MDIFFTLHDTAEAINIVAVNSASNSCIRISKVGESDSYYDATAVKPYTTLDSILVMISLQTSDSCTQNEASKLNLPFCL